MKINIFGVGRSGTKAVQSYLSYQLAKTYGKVWINYEPFYYYSRLGPINFNSFWKHYYLPHFIHKSYVPSLKYERFLKKLIQHPKVPIVTKFIRGNGRIGLINKVTNPDITIVIVRDLYQTISSVLGETWDYYRLGALDGFPLGRIDYFEKIYTNFKGLEINTNKYIDKIAIENINSSNRVIKNSLYWYWMNKYVLSIDLKNVLYINYDELNLLPQYLSVQYPDTFPEYEPITANKFTGSLFQSNTVLQVNKSKLKTRKYLNHINEILFYSLGSKIKYSPSIPLFSTGELNTINHNFSSKTSSVKKKIKPFISQNKPMDEMNEEVLSILENKKSKLFFN